MNIFSKLKRGYRMPMLVGAFAGLLISVLIMTLGQAQGVSFNNPGQDCDDNAVIRCGGADTSTLIKRYNGNASAQDIFNYFGISKAEVQSMNTTAVAGKVTKSGDVVVNGTVVATGAKTAGRQNIGNSTKVTHSGTTFYTRTPSVSFLQNSLDAYVVMQDGKFAFAVIAACGNPVNATPKNPNYTINKEVQVKGGTSWSDSVTVKPGARVTYRVTVSSTGQIPVEKLTVSDKLPANTTYVSGTLARDGKKQTGDSSYFGNGLNLGTLKQGTKTVLTYDAIIGKNDTIDNCVAKTLVNTAKMSATGMPGKQDTANVKEECQPKQPNYTIGKEVQVKGGNSWSKNVTVKPGTAVTYRVTVTNTGNSTLNSVVVNDKLPQHVTYTNGTLKQDGASVSGDEAFFANGVTIASLAAGKKVVFTYDATVGASDTVENCTPGVLKNTATVKSGSLGPKDDSATVNKQCEPKPVYICKSLSVTNSGDRTKFTFVTAVELQNATLKQVVYTVKDKNGATVDTFNRENLSPVSYTQTKEGTYSVTAAVTVTVNGKDAQATGDCAAEFTVTPEPVTPVYECKKLSFQPVSTQKNTYRFVVSYKAEGGATLQKVVISWGDGTANTEAPLNSLDNILHTFATAGTYKQNATLTFIVNGDEQNVKTVTCGSEVTVAPEKCPVPGKEHLPVDSKDCFTPCPTNPEIPASDKERCTTPTPPETPEEETPEVLVNTGPADVIGMFASTTIAGMIAYRFVWLRRFNG